MAGRGGPRRAHLGTTACGRAGRGTTRRTSASATAGGRAAAGRGAPRGGIPGQRAQVAGYASCRRPECRSSSSPRWTGPDSSPHFSTTRSGTSSGVSSASTGGRGVVWSSRASPSGSAQTPRPAARLSIPRLGEHTTDVLIGLGVDDDELATLTASGTIAGPPRYRGVGPPARRRRTTPHGSGIARR